MFLFLQVLKTNWLLTGGFGLTKEKCFWSFFRCFALSFRTIAYAKILRLAVIKSFLLFLVQQKKCTENHSDPRQDTCTLSFEKYMQAQTNAKTLQKHVSLVKWKLHAKNQCVLSTCKKMLQSFFAANPSVVTLVCARTCGTLSRALGQVVQVQLALIRD